MRSTFPLILLLLLALPVYSQKMKTVEGEYIYYAPENVTLEEARNTALNRAMIQALADEFGTIVSQTNSSIVSNRNGKSEIDFQSIGGSEVKGEWIETIGEPKYEISYSQNMLVVKVLVKGRAREILTTAIDFKVHVLRNGTDDKFESDEFRNGDDLYLSFLSPVKGYLAVYLIDTEKRAFCLLPYRNQADGIYKIDANRRYVFFDTKSVPLSERPFVDEYVMTSERSAEYNQIYIIFSPNQFAKAADNEIDSHLPRELDFSVFQNWLVKCRKFDKDMNLWMVSIKIISSI